MDDLLVRAERVFPLKPIPKQLVLATIDINLDIPSEIAARIDGKTWNKVVAQDWLNIATIESIRATMPVDAFRYYLPSFLCLAVTSKPMLSYAIGALLPANQKRVEKGEWWSEFKSGIAKPQSAFICDMLLALSAKTADGSDDEADCSIAIELWDSSRG